MFYKLDEKSKYIKDLEHREKNWEVQMENIKRKKKDLEDQLNYAKETLHENKGKFNKEVIFSCLPYKLSLEFIFIDNSIDLK